MKGQYLILNAMFFLLLFLLFVTLFVEYAVVSPGKGVHDELVVEAERIAQSLVLSGYPTTWTSSNVQRIGLVNNNDISQEKLHAFMDLANNEYDRTKLLFGSEYNYVVQVRRPGNVFTIPSDTRIGEASDVAIHKRLVGQSTITVSVYA